MRDVDVDGTVTNRHVTSARVLEQARTRHYAACTPHQCQQQIELDAREVGNLAVDGDLPSADIQTDTTDVQVLFARIELGAAQHGAQACEQLARAEGLTEIVVRTELETDH